MLTAYLDETGHSKDPNKKYVGLAGMVATAERWEAFERDWRQALEDFEVPNNFFHMMDFAQSQGPPYDGWKNDETKRRTVLDRLMAIIRNTGMPFGAVVNLEAYRATSATYQAGAVDPYYICLQHCVHGAAVQTLYEAPEERIRVVFADQPEYRGKIVPLYAALKASKEMAHYDLRLAENCSIEDPREIIPLQAADVIAYEVGQYFEKFVHRSDVKPRWGFLEIVRMSLKGGQGALSLSYYGKERLQQSQHEWEVVEAHNAAVKPAPVFSLEMLDEMIERLTAARDQIRGKT